MKLKIAKEIINPKRTLSFPLILWSTAIEIQTAHRVGKRTRRAKKQRRSELKQPLGGGFVERSELQGGGSGAMADGSHGCSPRGRRRRWGSEAAALKRARPHGSIRRGAGVGQLLAREGLSGGPGCMGVAGASNALGERG